MDRVWVSEEEGESGVEWVDEESKLLEAGEAEEVEIAEVVGSLTRRAQVSWCEGSNAKVVRQVEDRDLDEKVDPREKE